MQGLTITRKFDSCSRMRLGSVGSIFLRNVGHREGRDPLLALRSYGSIHMLTRPLVLLMVSWIPLFCRKLMLLSLNCFLMRYLPGISQNISLCSWTVQVGGDSTPNRPQIPIQIGHPFHLKSATDSEANRPGIPMQIGHPGKGKSDAG
jgi:hypothetical protein